MYAVTVDTNHSYLSGLLFIPDLIGSSLNLPDYNEHDIYGHTRILGLSPKISNKMEQDLSDVAYFTVKVLYGFGMCKDDSKIREITFIDELSGELKKVNELMLALGDQYNWLSLRKTNVEYVENEKTNLPGGFGIKLIENFMRVIDEQILRSAIQMQKQIDKHLIPLSMKFGIENFVECKEEVGCEFDDICSLISSKK